MELTLALYLGIFAVAFLIGATAIGGLLLVPLLVIWGGYPVHTAIPVCLFSIFFSGIVGSLIFGAKGHVRLVDIGNLALPAGAAALIGALLLPFVPSKGIEILIAVLCFGGFWVSSRLTGNSDTAEDPSVSQARLIYVGIATGLGSSLSGTGGPLILIPILTFLGYGAKRSVGMAQAIQLPIAAFAGVGNLVIGTINFSLALPVAGAVVVGSACGAVFGQRVNGGMLRQLVSFMLLICGIIYAGRLF